MRNVIAIFLVLAVFLQVGAKLGIVALYEVNKDYIAAELCENRTKPELNCNGKCYLKKQLDKAEDSEPESNNSNQIEVLQLVSYCLPPGTWVFAAHYSESSILMHFSRYNSFAGFNIYKDIFHPPQPAC